MRVGPAEKRKDLDHRLKQAGIQGLEIQHKPQSSRGRPHFHDRTFELNWIGGQDTLHHMDVSLTGGRIHAVDKGSGFPLLILHGGLLDHRHMVDALEPVKEAMIMSDISILGLGQMGSAMARALLASGRSVTVSNRSPEKAHPFIEAGAEVAASAADAISESEVSILCIRNHKATAELLRPISGTLPGKTVLQLSTGSAKEAEDLVELLTGAGAGWLIGMINAYPGMIGKADTVILCASPEMVWDEYGDVIRTLAGASEHIGTSPAAIPGLFAAMFTARLGFYFGLIYGAAVCRNADVPLDVFVGQMPLTLKVAGLYADNFQRKVPEQSYDDTEATLETYLGALNGILATYEETGATDDFPRLMRDLTQRGFDEGNAAKDLTVLIETLSKNS